MLLGRIALAGGSVHECLHLDFEIANSLVFIRPVVKICGLYRLLRVNAENSLLFDHIILREERVGVEMFSI